MDEKIQTSNVMQTSQVEKGSRIVTGSQIKARQMESRMQYIPYEKTIIQYEEVTRVEYIPKERKVIEYYPVEYQTEYIPQVYQQKVIEYVPVEKIQQRVEYVPVERQIFYPPQEQGYEIEGEPVEIREHPGSHIIETHGKPHSKTIVQPLNISSRIQPPTIGSNMSFQNSRWHQNPPHTIQNNAPYTKEPLPSSKRQPHIY